MTRSATLSLSPRRLAREEFCCCLTTPRCNIAIVANCRPSIAVSSCRVTTTHCFLSGLRTRYRRAPGGWGETSCHSTGIPIIMAIGPRITAPHTEPFNPTRFVTSWILPPGVLFGIRALSALYAFTTLFTIFGWNGGHGRSAESQQSFSYFTVLTYWGLAFYYAFAAVHTASYWRTGEPFLAGWPRALQAAHSMLYSTIVVYPWLVTSKWAAQDCVYA